ncbi:MULTISPECIES: DUF3631 domain-containing protein [Streptomyces]|uniref:DUF3631 domain-containing protein n=2 Tax=Streptomyces TaxID=1883 RepID=A0A100Y6E1_9ACTN|nr:MULTISPECIES: DUF3631 domain-containing protein [Streptomyces]KUH38560.1 hypothetical protein ATE80_11815 [Streptomyces kanasensis]UUS33957.1 DUF3631 domain-containing protein [Streptomyces changanensis]
MTAPRRTSGLPDLIGRLLTDALYPVPAPHPHHQTLLQVKDRQAELDKELRAVLAGPEPRSHAEAEAELDDIVNLLIDRLDVARDLGLLLGDDTCCTGMASDEKEPVHISEGLAATGDGARRALRVNAPCVVCACLSVFDDYGCPDALASADLVAALRTMNGTAEGRWRYAELTQARLATLLRAYEVASRDITLPDGRRRKSYRRTALLAALPDDCAC